MVKELHEKSGWGWDPIRHVATALDSSWDAVILVCPLWVSMSSPDTNISDQVNNKMKIWHTKPFLLYNQIQPLVKVGT